MVKNPNVFQIGIKMNKYILSYLKKYGVHGHFHDIALDCGHPIWFDDNNNTDFDYHEDEVGYFLFVPDKLINELLDKTEHKQPIKEE